MDIIERLKQVTGDKNRATAKAAIDEINSLRAVLAIAVKTMGDDALAFLKIDGKK